MTNTNKNNFLFYLKRTIGAFLLSFVTLVFICSLISITGIIFFKDSLTEYLGGNINTIPHFPKPGQTITILDYTTDPLVIPDSVSTNGFQWKWWEKITFHQAIESQIIPGLKKIKVNPLTGEKLSYPPQPVYSSSSPAKLEIQICNLPLLENKSVKVTVVDTIKNKSTDYLIKIASKNKTTQNGMIASSFDDPPGLIVIGIIILFVTISFFPFMYGILLYEPRFFKKQNK